MVNLDDLDDKIIDDKFTGQLTEEGLMAYGEGKGLENEINSNHMRKILYLVGGMISTAVCTASTTNFLLNKDETYAIPYMIITAALTIYSGVQYAKNANIAFKNTEKLSELQNNPEYQKTEKILGQYNI